jgi:hypothetical protein
LVFNFILILNLAFMVIFCNPTWYILSDWIHHWFEGSVSVACVSIRDQTYWWGERTFFQLQTFILCQSSTIESWTIAL